MLLLPLHIPLFMLHNNERATVCYSVLSVTSYYRATVTEITLSPMTFALAATWTLNYAV